MSAADSAATSGAGGLKRGLRLLPGDTIFTGLTGLAAVASGLLIVAIAVTVFRDAWPAFERFGFGFVADAVWDPVRNIYGARDFLVGTVISSAFAVLIGAPTAIAIALFLTEIAPRRLRGPVALLVELIASIPSVVVGLWGLLVLGPILDKHVEPWLHDHLGFIPLFGGPPSQVGMLNAIVILTIMIVPIITAITRDLLLRTPRELREGALGLGLTDWEAIRGVVIPYAGPGIAAATILGLGRALGESIAVAQVIGSATGIHVSLFHPSDTLAARIANEYFGAASQLQINSLIGLGAILLLITLLANIGAQVIVLRAERRGVL
jgi:phosphate transport system permease protein